jgi:hypothetical protein
VAEPRGVHQPIRVDVTIRRNGNPLPADFHCGPVSAVATTVTPYGAVGQPYLAAASVSDVAYDYSFDAGWVQDRTFTVYLHEPNPSVHIAPENMPPESDLDDLLGDVLNAALGDLGNVIQSSAWESLLVPDSVVGVKVWGDCVGEASAGEEPLHVAAVVPPPLPRITPGES